jgi:protein subunit release factor A
LEPLRYGKTINGRQELKEDLVGTFEQVSVRWKENNVESLLIQGDTAVEQTNFAIEVSPKHGGDPSLFKGRVQVVYVRYSESPTGWATIREMIQPEPSRWKGGLLSTPPN